MKTLCSSLLWLITLNMVAIVCQAQPQAVLYKSHAIGSYSGELDFSDSIFDFSMRMNNPESYDALRESVYDQALHKSELDDLRTAWSEISWIIFASEILSAADSPLDEPLFEGRYSYLVESAAVAPTSDTELTTKAVTILGSTKRGTQVDILFSVSYHEDGPTFEDFPDKAQLHFGPSVKITVNQFNLTNQWASLRLHSETENTITVKNASLGNL